MPANDSTPAAPRSRSGEERLIVYQHSDLLYWWAVWAYGYFCALIAWYAVQVHQTKYLVETGFTPPAAAWALGIVSVVGIPGQISLGGLSDRIGREWVWTAGCAGFAICYAALIALEYWPTTGLLYISSGLVLERS